MSIAALNTTTVTNALDASTQTFLVGATTNIAVGAKLVIGNEVLWVQAVPVSGTVQCMRGVDGTKARSHAAAATIYIGSGTTLASVYGSVLQFDNRVGLAGDPGTLPDFCLPVGTYRVDPNTGFEYLLGDAAGALTINEWCLISGTGSLSQLAATDHGRVGIIIETVAGSDTLTWVLVAGTHATARSSSDFASSMIPQAGTGIINPYLNSVGGNIVWRANATGAASGTSSLADDTCPVYIDHPYVQGVEFWLNSV